MALDPTLSEANYKYSVRRYFLNYLEEVRGKKVYFDRQYAIPQENGVNLTNWFVVFFNGIHIDTISTGMLEVYCYSRKDEGDLILSSLRDMVVDMFVEEDQPDGMQRVPLYDAATKIEFTKMLGFVDSRYSGIERGADGTNASKVDVQLKWGTK